MKTTTRIAATAAALLSITAVDARAQLLELPTGNAAGDLTSHQIRVVQLALREHECYRGPINGRWTSATRTGLTCARERTSATDPEALARALALWSTDGMTTRDMAGDVAPTATPTPAPTPTPQPDSTPMPNPQPDSMPAPRPDSMPTPRSDSMPTPRPDSMPAPAPMPTPDSTPPTSPAARADSASMPMTPTDPLSPMSRVGMTSAQRDSIMRTRSSDPAAAADPAEATGGASMLAAHLDSAVTAAEAGFVGMPAERSRTVLQGLEQQLGSAGTPALSALGSQFATLRTQLGATPVDSAQVGRTMTELSTRIDAAVTSAPSDVQAQLRRLGAALRAEGQRLSPR